jgi:hypothetical protein
VRLSLPLRESTFESNTFSTITLDLTISKILSPENKPEPAPVKLDISNPN